MRYRVNPGVDEFDTAIGGLAPGGGWPQKCWWYDPAKVGPVELAAPLTDERPLKFVPVDYDEINRQNYERGKQ